MLYQMSYYPSGDILFSFGVQRYEKYFEWSLFILFFVP